MEQLELLIKEKIGTESLENEINKKIKSFSGLLTKEAAIKLLAKELGIKIEKNYFLKDIPKNEKNFGFMAKIKKIWPIANYKSGKQSVVLDIQDDTSESKLILWNKDVDLSKSLRKDDVILVKNAYEKNNELFLGFSGSIEIEKKSKPTDISSLLEGEEYHVRGFVKSILQKSGYEKSFILTDGNTNISCELALEDRRFEKISQNDEVLLENVLFQNNKIQISTDSKLLIRKSKPLLVIDELEAITENNEEKLLVKAGKKEILLTRKEALKLLGLDQSDLLLSTLIHLKSESIIGKSSTYL